MKKVGHATITLRASTICVKIQNPLHLGYEAYFFVTQENIKKNKKNLITLKITLDLCIILS